MPKKDEPKKSLTNNSAKSAIRLGSRSELFEQRNSLIPSKEEELDQLQAELTGYAYDKDTGVGTEIQTNQGKILSDVAHLLKEDKDGRGIFEAVKTLFSKKDLVWTDQLNKVGMRLTRLYQLERQGTTDVLDPSSAKDELKKHGMELLGYYKGNDRTKAVFILKNVENSRADTTELSLDDLYQTRDMVAAALRDKLVKDYQIGLNPQTLEGPDGDMQRIKTDVSPEIISYLRLFESLSIAIIRQQEITREKQVGLDLKKEKVLSSLDRLGEFQGISISSEARDKFMDRMSTMLLDELEFFDLKISDLIDRLENEKVGVTEANTEIGGWLLKDFTQEGLHQDREKLHIQDEKYRNTQLKILRGELKATPITKTVDSPVSQSEYKKAA